MKQDKRPAGAAVKKRRFFNRISRKLMLFVVLMSMVLLALVWLLSVKLLEPMYNRRVLADLNHAADVYSAIIEKYGKFESFDKSGGVHIPSDMMEEIMDNRGLLAGKCFEVAGTDCKVLLHLHQLQSDQCLLHPNPLSQLMEYSEPQWNSTAAVNLRATTFVLGDLNFTLPDSRILPGLESTSGTRQMVVCRNINNQYSLILSTDLERVGQAADVISAQMPIIAAVLLIVSIAGAYVFSRWFTKPISAISRAAREMARGNYKVRVTPQADDELGALAGDFNTMAREVGRTSELQRDLIANVSHDLRTPLTLIKGYADIDLTGETWTPIGSGFSSNTGYQGTFDGQGHSITGLSITTNSTDGGNAVLFDGIGSNGTVKNLQVEVNYNVQQGVASGIVNVNYGTITACSVTGDIAARTSDIGGIASINNGSIIGCWFDGNLTTNYVEGGIAAYNYGTITACFYGGNAGQGVYSNQGETAETTKVNDGDSWQTAVDGMNNALTSNDYKWELGADGLPVLQSNQ